MSFTRECPACGFEVMIPGAGSAANNYRCESCGHTISIIETAPHARYGTETYLGDGLYASWNGTYVRLRAPRESEDHVVYLDASVLMSLETFLAKLKQRLR